MNKIASAILLDVGCRKLSTSKESFFSQSKDCLSRLVMRKMFSNDNDDMGIILFGSEQTDNAMANGDSYQNIYTLTQFGKPNYKMYDQVQSITQCKDVVSDWVEGIIVALDFLNKCTKGKRYKTKQVVLMSKFSCSVEYDDNKYTLLSDCFKDQKVTLTVVGPDLTDCEQVPKQLTSLMTFFQQLQDPLSLSIDELKESIKYFEKKRKTRRISNIDLEIGSKISIPIGWVKVTSESQRFTNWVDKSMLTKQDKTTERAEGIERSAEEVSVEDMDEGESVVSSYRTAPSVMGAENVVKMAKFGDTQVSLYSADLNALKRASGPSSFKVLLFTGRNRINPTMYVGDDVFAVLPREGSKYSQAKLYALVDAMISKKKIAVARRIVMNNGKIQIGALIPFSDDCGKHLFFMKLPTAEWAQPFPRHKGYPKVTDEVKKLFNDLIDRMTLPTDLVEEDKGVLVPDPNFQFFCHFLSQQLLDPESDRQSLPEYIERIYYPCPEFKDATRPLFDEILNNFPSLNPEVRKQTTLARSPKKETKRSQFRPQAPSTMIKSDPEITDSTPTVKEPQPEEEDDDLFLSQNDYLNCEDMKEFSEVIKQMSNDIEDAYHSSV